MPMKKNTITPLNLIGNADQTPVFFDMPMNITVNKKGENSILLKTTGNEKSRITVMLCALADGKKLPPYVILKRKTMPKEMLPSGIIIRVQENGWMDENLVVDWLKTVWGKHMGLRRPQSVLILDAYRGHLNESVKKRGEKIEHQFSDYCQGYDLTITCVRCG
jgi:hypothetical protein